MTLLTPIARGLYFGDIDRRATRRIPVKFATAPEPAVPQSDREIAVARAVAAWLDKYTLN